MDTTSLKRIAQVALELRSSRDTVSKIRKKFGLGVRGTYAGNGAWFLSAEDIEVIKANYDPTVGRPRGRRSKYPRTYKRKFKK